MSGLKMTAPAAVAPLIYDGNLGAGFLSQVTVAADLDRGRMWMARPQP